jgi:hypothetical protein
MLIEGKDEDVQAWIDNSPHKLLKHLAQENDVLLECAFTTTK